MTCGIVCESTGSVNRFRTLAAARLPGDSSSCCRRCTRKMYSEMEYLSLRQRSEAQQRIKIAKNLGGFARKRGARGRRGRVFASNDPRQYLFPILRRCGPTGVLGPFPLHRRVPVAFVTAAEALFLLGARGGLRFSGGLGNQWGGGFFAFPAKIEEKPRRDRIH